MERGSTPRVVERAQAELARGEPWRARRRLASYVASGPYLPEALALLGRVCHQMGDWPEAGRAWLLSDAEGEEVERAVALFVSLHGEEPRRLVAQLPRRTRLASPEAYPPAARRRIDALGLEAALTQHAWAPRAARGTKAPGAKPTAIVWGCFVGLALVVGLCLYGLVSLVRALG
jgi:hypothetical protein